MTILVYYFVFLYFFLFVLNGQLKCQDNNVRADQRDGGGRGEAEHKNNNKKFEEKCKEKRLY